MTTTWSSDELDRVGTADELEITSARADGSLRRWTPIWVVRVDDNLYVRSYRGADGAWYRHVSAAGQGRIRAGAIERDVTASPVDGAVRPAVDAAYRAKYGRYGATYLDPMLAPPAVAATLRLIPKEN